MFLMHGVDPAVIGKTDYFDLMDLLNTPDDDPIFSASELLNKGSEQSFSYNVTQITSWNNVNWISLNW